ncbi:MAG: ATP-binding cassette domain-containing protein, partial [Candidatus Poseidoniaceae archaeon]
MIPDVSQTGQAVEQQWVPEPKAPVVMLNNVGKTYGRYQALAGVSLALTGGVTGILGLNGAGKSTLFKLLMGKLQTSQGEVRLFGTNPWKNPAPYARVGYVPEN